MSEQSVDPGFYDSVVTTSAHTSVDTDELIGAALGVMMAKETAQNCYASLVVIQLMASSAVMLGVDSGRLIGAVEDAMTAVSALVVRLESLSNRLTAAAMKYLSAEGDAQRFVTARMLLVDGRVSWTPLSPLTTGLTAGQVYGYANEFSGKMHSDPTLGYRVEFDMATLGTTVNSLSTRRDLYGFRPDAGQQAWWGSPRTQTVDAARVASQLFFTVGQRATGPLAGLQITTSQISDAGGSGRPQRSSQIRVVNPSIPKTGVAALAGVPPLWLTARSAVNASSRASGVSVSNRYAPTPRLPRTVPTPRSGSELLGRVSQLESGSDTFGQLEILKHETPQPDGSTKRSWSVVVRGTQKWTPGQTNPQDMLSNLQAVGHDNNDLSAATLEAMDMAGIAPDEPVEFVGHSQSGITNTQLIADPDTTRKYTVVSSLTAGSPTGNYVMPEGVHTLFMENTRDIVPPLDGSPNMDVNDAVTVSFDGDLVGPLDGEGLDITPHGLEPYTKAFDALNDPSAYAAPPEVREWSRHREQSLGLSDQTVTTSQLFNTRRIFADE